MDTVRLAFAVAFLGMAPAFAQTLTEIVLHNFASLPGGTNPQAGVIRDAEGNLYGTTVYHGSPSNGGTVYKIDKTGRETVLHSFMGEPDGYLPLAGVIRDADGNLYGTTSRGGTADAGVVYKVDAAGQETVLYSFTGWADGANPQGELVRDSAGNLYGTTPWGGVGMGVVYKLDATGHQTVLYTFRGAADGGHPYAGVILDEAGNLYGTTNYGGAFQYFGTVFKLDAAGQETVLYSFMDKGDGEQPTAGVIRDAAGNLYGTAALVFKLDTAGHETVLYTFGSGTGGEYLSGVVRDGAGNLYGTFYSGGGNNPGVVYKLDTTGHETVLHSFAGGRDGAAPNGGVTLDAAGNLYGTTEYGGPANGGVVYRVDGTGQERILHTFAQRADAENPESGVIRDAAGNFYGTTYNGGPNGRGTVYKVDTAGHETVLYSFTGGADGANPRGGVIRDSDGNFYGTTYAGGSVQCGPEGCGAVYELDASGHETVLYSFTGGADGAEPMAGVIRDAAGNLYGTTPYGGAAGAGVVYKLDAAGNETVLYNFTGGADGGNPYSGVIRDEEGNLFGTTYYGGHLGGNCPDHGCGVVYKLDAAGQETVLHAFIGPDGALPIAGVIRDPDGNFYGTTYYGGSDVCIDNHGCGVVYQLNAKGELTTVHQFTRGNGVGPAAGVIRDAAGNLYGTTSAGGAATCNFRCGLVYKLDPSGHETALAIFTAANGANPSGGVILDEEGNLFGTTAYGGEGGSGVVFKLKAAAPPAQ